MFQSARTSRLIAGLAMSLLLAGFATTACHLTADIGQPTTQTQLKSAVAAATSGPGIETDQTRTPAGPETIPVISPAFNRSNLTGEIPAISPTLTPAPTPEPTAAPSPDPTATPGPTASPTPKPTAPPRPTATPAPKPTAAPIFDPVHLPGVPANWPTVSSQQKRVDTFITLVNQARADAGLPALAKGGAVLQEMAAIRAAEISILFSHSRPTDVATCDHWSELMKIMGVRYLLAGENIAGINTPEAAMNAFMNSDGHRKNILGANFKTIAIGVYTDQTGKDWWAQEFTD